MSTRQLLGNWGPLDILIFDWEANPENNRELFKKTREDRGKAGYENQLISSVDNWVQNQMEFYDQQVLSDGWPFGSADAPMGMRKQIGSIYKNNYMEYVNSWTNVGGYNSIDDLFQSDDFHWEFDTGAYHEYIHIWQVSQNKHGFINTIAGCYSCNEWSEKDPNLNKQWVSPRWFQEGQAAVIQAILAEKMGYRAEHSHCCTIPPPVFEVRNYINDKLLGDYNVQGYLLGEREESPSSGFAYFTLGEVASFYKFAKMNYDFQTFKDFEVARGSYGYAYAMQQFLGMSEDAFNIEFNNWYYNPNLTQQQKLDFLYPEGLNPIPFDIQKRRN